MSQHRAFEWKSHWKRLGWDHMHGARESSGTRGGYKNVSQADGDSDMASAFQLCVGEDSSKNNGLLYHFCLREM